MVTDLTLWGKIIDLNNFKTDIIDDAIEEFRLTFEKTSYVIGGLINIKELSYEKWTQWEDSIYNYATSGEKSCGVHLSYVIIKLAREDINKIFYKNETNFTV